MCKSKKEITNEHRMSSGIKAAKIVNFRNKKDIAINFILINIWSDSLSYKYLAPVVQKVDDTIH